MPEDLSSAQVADVFELDPEKSNVVMTFGRKGTGKSVLCTWLFQGYPYDRVLIDNTGDVDPDLRFTAPIHPPFPASWPEDADGRLSLRFRPNHRDAQAVVVQGRKVPKWRADVDDLVGLVMAHGRTALLVDEIGETFPVAKTMPNTDDMLHTLRHRDVSLFGAAPRPVGLDSLCLTQADLVAMFAIPHELDNRRLAATLGLPERELYALNRALEPYAFLLFDQRVHELYHCDPLPV